MKCPNCDGIGKILGFHPKAHVTCNICAGAGILPENIDYDPKIGEICRFYRRISGKTLRNISNLTSIDAQILAEQERGFFRREE